MWDSTSVIAHIDLDCFFASVHIKNNPFLERFPVIIGSDPKQGKGRGVISTCSYPARNFGLHSAMPISKAFQLCPNGVYICSWKKISFPQYNEESDRVMEILQKYTDKFQKAGIDEAYLDITHKWKQYGDSPKAIAEEIQKKIKEELSLSVSIGIAETKSIAKIASDLHKPNGISVVHNSELEKKLYHLSIRKIIGVGKKTEKQLNKLGIMTIGDIGLMSRERVYTLLGDHGLYLKKIALGKNHKEVGNSRTKRKSISSERTFGTDQNDWQIVNNMIQDIVSKITKQLEKRSLLAKTISIKIRFEGYITYTRSYSYSSYLIDESTFFNQAMRLLDEFRVSTKKVRLVGVRLSGLKSRKRQLSLYSFIN